MSRPRALPLTSRDEPSEKGSHRPPFVGEDPDVAFRPAKREDFDQPAHALRSVTQRAEGQRLESPDLNDAAHPPLCRGLGGEASKQGQGSIRSGPREQ
jgi:hypothetical protein